MVHGLTFRRGLAAACLALAVAAPTMARADETPAVPPVRLAGLFDFLKPRKAPPPPRVQPRGPRQPYGGPPQRDQRPRPAQPPRATRPEPKRGKPRAARTFRTLCVRTCDGYYFPISYKVTSTHFQRDAAMCAQRCPSAPARLYVYRNPGQKPGNAVDLQGNRYRDLENAFRYRKELVKGCSCDGEAWLTAEGGSDKE